MQAEEKLTMQDHFLQILIDSLPVSVFYKNTYGIYTGCNNSFARFLGISKDMIIGKSAYDIFPIGIADKHNEMDEKLIENHGIQNYEFQMTHADGSKRDVLIRQTAYHDESCKLIGIIGVIIDLSIQKKTESDLREREELLRQLFDNMKDCVSIFQSVENGQDFVFVDLNKRGLLFWKKTREQVIGKKVTEVFPGVMEVGLPDVFRNVYITGRPQYHPLYYKYDAIELWLENYIFQLPSGLIVAIYKDTSEKKIKEMIKVS